MELVLRTRQMGMSMLMIQLNALILAVHEVL